MFRFETPWAFLALLAPALLALWRRKRPAAQPALPVASLSLFRDVKPSWRVRLRWIPAAVAAIGWLLLTVALARPQHGQEQFRNINHGIAIEMVLDRSGSMRASMTYWGKRFNRLETVKEVFRDFVFGGSRPELTGHSDLGGRRQDLLGVIAFAHYPYTACPLTLDHNALDFALKNVRLVTDETDDPDENGTAIGDAVAMAVARLVSAEQTLAAQTKTDASTYRIKSKVIILLTDGQDEGPHTYSIGEAADLARKNHIKVYSIAIVPPAPTLTTPMGLIASVEPPYDTTEIEAMAKTTGGLFRKCDNGRALEDIYGEIDQLEKSEVEAVRYVTRRELFFPFAVAGAIALLAALLLKTTLFRRTI